MKFIAVLGILVSTTFAGLQEFATEFKEIVREVGTGCLSEADATNDHLDSILKKEIPTQHEAMCLVLCMHKHWGIQNSEGKLDYDAATKLITPLQDIDMDMYDKVKTVLKTCMDKVDNDADPCLTAMNLAKCEKEEGEKLGLDKTYEI